MDEKVARLIQREGGRPIGPGRVRPLEGYPPPVPQAPAPAGRHAPPRLGGLIRLARVYLSLGVTAEQMNKFTKEEEMAFLVTHGKQVSRMVAYTLCRGWISRRLLVGATAWVVRNWIDTEYVSAAMRSFVFLLGTDPFTSIIRSAERTNPMKLRLSQRDKGS